MYVICKESIFLKFHTDYVAYNRVGPALVSVRAGMMNSTSLNAYRLCCPSGRRSTR